MLAPAVGDVLRGAVRPAEAADRFQKAIDQVPDGRYYANLCLALYHVGKLGEALTACKAVATHGGDVRAVKQADNLMEKAIKPKMREAGIDPDAPEDDAAIAALADRFRRYLLHCHHELGLSRVQPGRFTNPGDLEGSPLLHFCPLPPGTTRAGTNRARMAERWESMSLNEASRVMCTTAALLIA